MSKKVSQGSPHFDPYRKWLGILPQDQPPHLYRLLGVDIFEDDPDVIDGHADKQMAYLRSFSTGENAHHAEKLLSEVASARLCLLDSQSKADYDTILKARLGATTQEDQSPAFHQPQERIAQAPASPARQVRQPVVSQSAALPINTSVGSISSLSSLSSGHAITRNSRKKKNKAVYVLGHIVSPFIGLALGYLVLCLINPRADFLGIFKTEDNREPFVASENSAKQSLVKEPNRGSSEHTPPDSFVHQPQDATHQSPEESQKTEKNRPPIEVEESREIDSEPPSQVEKVKTLQSEITRAIAEGDVRAAIDMVGTLASLEGKEALASKAQVLEEMHSHPISSSNKRVLAEKSIELLEEAVSKQDKETAKRLANLSLVAARHTKDELLVRRATLAILKYQRLSKQ